MLEITNLHAIIAGKPILNGVSLHVREVLQLSAISREGSAG